MPPPLFGGTALVPEHAHRSSIAHKETFASRLALQYVDSLVGGFISFVLYANGTRLTRSGPVAGWLPPILFCDASLIVLTKSDLSHLPCGWFHHLSYRIEHYFKLAIILPLKVV